MTWAELLRQRLFQASEGALEEIMGMCPRFVFDYDDDCHWRRGLPCQREYCWMQRQVPEKTLIAYGINEKEDDDKNELV